MVKQSKIITPQPKTIENPNVIDKKSVTLEHPKISHNLSKSLRQAKKIPQVSSAGKNSTSLLYKKRTKTEFFLMEKRL